MDDVSIARALHVIAVIHWIGGVAMVTSVILPSLMRSFPPTERSSLFEMIEGSFSRHVCYSIAIAGVSGIYMTERLSAWDRFADPSQWWMHAMVAIWCIFAFVVFIAEPLFLHRWFAARAKRDPEGTMKLVWRMHVMLLTLSLATAGAAVLGAHGALS